MATQWLHNGYAGRSAGGGVQRREFGTSRPTRSLSQSQVSMRPNMFSYLLRSLRRYWPMAKNTLGSITWQRKNCARLWVKGNRVGLDFGPDDPDKCNRVKSLMPCCVRETRQRKRNFPILARNSHIKGHYEVTLASLKTQAYRAPTALSSGTA